MIMRVFNSRFASKRNYHNHWWQGSYGGGKLGCLARLYYSDVDVSEGRMASMWNSQQTSSSLQQTRMY